MIELVEDKSGHGNHLRIVQPKKPLTQVGALAQWMKKGKWIDLNIAAGELRITRLPEIIARLKRAIHERERCLMIEETTVAVNTMYGKTHIKRWRVYKYSLSHYGRFLKEFLN